VDFPRPSIQQGTLSKNTRFDNKHSFFWLIMQTHKILIVGYLHQKPKIDKSAKKQPAGLFQNSRFVKKSNEILIHCSWTHRSIALSTAGAALNEPRLKAALKGQLQAWVTPQNPS